MNYRCSRPALNEPNSGITNTSGSNSTEQMLFGITCLSFLVTLTFPALSKHHTAGSPAVKIALVSLFDSELQCRSLQLANKKVRSANYSVTYLYQDVSLAGLFSAVTINPWWTITCNCGLHSKQENLRFSSLVPSIAVSKVSLVACAVSCDFLQECQYCYVLVKI